MERDRQVHHLMARCIVDGPFLEALRNDPETALAAYGLDAATALSFRAMAPRIGQYAGLVTAVQNNGLWQHIPWTQKLLKHHDLHLRAFTAFIAPHRALRARRGVSRHETTVAFLDFLDGKLATDPDFDRPMLADLFAHERTFWAMQRGQAASSTPDRLRAAVYETDPLAVIAWLRAGGAPPPDVPTGLGYWIEPGSGLFRVLKLTPAAAALLAIVVAGGDPAQALDAIGAERASERREARAFLDDCRARGLLPASESAEAGR